MRQTQFGRLPTTAPCLAYAYARIHGILLMNPVRPPLPAAQPMLERGAICEKSLGISIRNSYPIDNGAATTYNLLSCLDLLVSTFQAFDWPCSLVPCAWRWILSRRPPLTRKLLER